MLQAQRHSPAPKRRSRLRFIAAVRFADGRQQCFSVDNAEDHDDARRMVFEELAEVAAVLVAPRR